MARAHPGSGPDVTGRRLLRLGLAAFLLGGAVSGAGAEDAPLTGGAAWEKIVGNTVSGATPDGSFSEFFAPDGTLRLVDSDGKVAGRWTLRNAKICTQVDDEDEDCRAVSVTGTAGAFTDDGGGRYPFDILPGNPKGL